MTRKCTLSTAIIVENKLVTCDGSTSIDAVSVLTIEGKPSAAQSVAITGSDLTVVLSGVELKLGSQFTVVASNVVVITQTNSSITTTTTDRAAIDCSGSSNLTFYSDPGAVLSVTGGTKGAGIGTGGSCHGLRFVNGTYLARAGNQGTGIGPIYGTNDVSIGELIFDLTGIE